MAYTCQDFIEKIPGTGGNKSMLADRVGCAWNTVDKYIEERPTVRKAWLAEKQRINDRARHNLVLEVEDGNIQISKWWLEHMDPEFMPKQRQEISGPEGGPVVVVSWDGTEDQD